MELLTIDLANCWQFRHLRGKAKAIGYMQMNKLTECSNEKDLSQLVSNIDNSVSKCTLENY